MPRPQKNWITLTIDGREVRAPENAMLVDGAKHGDVEIPVFCYEPKLGQPVGACRMCLVEIEGIPKLQTACSTAIKDGMVVYTQTERVREAQQGVVEFLLINHPLDCPVCDKGGECPLQDVTYGWGPGTSRNLEPKRHFKKPIELSPVVAIDRERCILCYRCVRFSQEVSEDHQLVLQERGAHSYVSTFDSHPYVAPFSGNIIELCPVGALTSTAYRFRARPWDIEDSGSICTMCPSQCNVSFTVRDEKVARVLARDNDAVDDGWLCDKGRFGYQHIHVDERITVPLVRDGADLLPASWNKAMQAAAGALKKAGNRVGALAGGETSNEEAFLLRRLMQDGIGSQLMSCGPTSELPVELQAGLASPSLQATVADLEFANVVLVLDCDPIDDAPIMELRIRKGVRRNGVKLAIASARPTALDDRATGLLRFTPDGAAGLLVALDGALAGSKKRSQEAATAAGTHTQTVQELAGFLSDAGEDIVVVYPERLFDGPNGEKAAQALLNVATRLKLNGGNGGGLLELPDSANGRGVREAGFGGSKATQIAEGLASGDLSVAYLLDVDPIRTEFDPQLWERALGKAQAVIAHESILSETARKYATVVFPAESYAEKEGTLVHPDGRLQRLRPAVGRPRADGAEIGSGVRPGWQVIAEIARALDFDLGVLPEEVPVWFAATAQASVVSQQLFEAIPQYASLTLEEIGGDGVRWQTRPAAQALNFPEWSPIDVEPPAARTQEEARTAGDGMQLLLGTYRSLWSTKEVIASPALNYAEPHQSIELSPVDAAQLGVQDGDELAISTPATTVSGVAKVRSGVLKGTVFAAEGLTKNSANGLNGTPVWVMKSERAKPAVAEAVA